jgi:hypothetical protein
VGFLGWLVGDRLNIFENSDSVWDLVWDLMGLNDRWDFDGKLSIDNLGISSDFNWMWI